MSESERRMIAEGLNRLFEQRGNLYLAFLEDQEKKAMSVAEEARAKFHSRHQAMWVAGSLHWCDKRTKVTLCDPDKHGVSPASEGEEVMCEKCLHVRLLRTRGYAKTVGKKYQMRLDLPGETKGKEALRR